MACADGSETSAVVWSGVSCVGGGAVMSAVRASIEERMEEADWSTSMGALQENKEKIV